MLIPAAQNMIHATILNRFVMTTTDIKFQVCPVMAPVTTRYTTRGFWKRVTKRLRSNYKPTHKSPSNTSGTAAKS